MALPFQLALGNNTPTTVTSAFGRIQLPDPQYLDVGGGAATQVLTTDGASNLYWAAVTATGTDAPSDGNTYGRVSGSWARVVKLSGDSMTGLLVLSGPPTLPLHAATKAYVDLRLLDAPVDGVTYGRNNAAWIPVTLASLGGAPLANPVFTGDPRAPTPLTADNDTSIATTGYVQAQGYATSAAMTAADALKAPLASPVLTGDPQAPTPATADSDTSIATTAFVKAQGYATGASVTAGDNLRVLKAGDTMTGNLTVNGPIISQGASAGYNFFDTVSGPSWSLAATSGNAQFWNSTNGFVASVSASGNLMVGSSLFMNGSTFVQCDSPNAGFNKLFDNSGNLTLYLGNASGQQQNLHCQVSHVFANRNNSVTFAFFNASGTANVSGAWTVLSDASVKQDVAPYSRGLDAVLALNPVQFRYIADSPFAEPDKPSRLLYGLLADQVAPHVPEIVGRTTATIKGADVEVDTLEPGNLIYACINAIKELAAKVTALEA